MGEELELKFETIAGGLVVRLSGRIDFHSAPELELRIKNELPGDAKFLLVNLSRVNYLPSMAIGTLLNLYRHSAELYIKMGLCELPPPIKRMLDLAEVGHTFPEFKTEAEALAALQSAE